MRTHVPGFQSFFKGFSHHFVSAKLTTNSIKDNFISLYTLDSNVIGTSITDPEVILEGDFKPV